MLLVLPFGLHLVLTPLLNHWVIGESPFLMFKSARIMAFL